jgi:hypothetical protein
MEVAADGHGCTGISGDWGGNGEREEGVALGKT